MKLITRHTDYAVIALCHMAKTGTPVSASELCTRFEMPRAFIRGILQKLNGAGLLASIKGKGGGFRLRKPAETISILDIMHILQPSTREDGCRFKKGPCPRRVACSLRVRLGRIENLVRNELSASTIAEIMATKK